MKLLSVFHNGNEISIHNSLWGVESVRYNGEEMCSKFSWWGATHRFSVYENSERIDYVVKIGFSIWGITANIYRNNEPIMLGLKSSCSNKKAGRTYGKATSEFV